MADYYIENNLTSIDISYYSSGSYRLYSISKKELGRTRGQDSEWLMQLMDKNWASKTMLSDLAGYIKRCKPDNKIDWESTFDIVDSLDN